jgi:hypothetical protein
VQRPRTPSQLSESMHKHLNAYALAATAAGVGALALTPPAEAKIVYTPAHHTIRKGQAYSIYFNHGRIPDFNVVIKASGQVFCVEGETYNNHIYNGVMINGTTGQGGGVGVTFKRGREIPGNYPSGSNGLLAGYNWLLSRYSGNWLPDKNRYLGMKFLIARVWHYGWARVSVRSHTHPFRVTGLVTGYAYETIPNKPIIAGATKGPDAATVQPATLGHLAAGASAIPAWRTDNTH